MNSRSPADAPIFPTCPKCGKKADKPSKTHNPGTLVYECPEGDDVAIDPPAPRQFPGDGPKS